MTTLEPQAHKQTDTHSRAIQTDAYGHENIQVLGSVVNNYFYLMILNNNDANRFFKK